MRRYMSPKKGDKEALAGGKGVNREVKSEVSHHRKSLYWRTGRIS